MLKLFMGNALWTLITQSDAVSKFVLFVLLCMSIICWTIFFYKLALFTIKKRQMRAAIERVKSVETLEQMLDVAAQYAGTMPGYFLSKNLAYLKGILQVRSEGGNALVSEQQWRAVQQNIYSTVDSMISFEESYISILSTSAAVSPLLGLFGTIWGLVHAFIGISEKQAADITTVAPGIAEALITTLAGLMVAIPALIMFNVVNVQINTLEQRLLVLADKFGLVVQKLFMKGAHARVPTNASPSHDNIARDNVNPAH